MIGAIAGDIIGSVFEAWNIKTKRFPLYDFQSINSTFTDDTVMTCAIADAILTGESYTDSMLKLGQHHPYRGYGMQFREWLFSGDQRPYNSMGNGSAMRVSPIAFAYDTLEDVLREAARSAEVTHNHPEGIKGAMTTAMAIFLARTGIPKEIIRYGLIRFSNYYLHQTLDEIRPTYSFDATCPHTVPEAIIAFLESTCYEDAIRSAISLGGASDTLACITGAIASAYYRHIPDEIVRHTRERLDDDLLEIMEAFLEKYPLRSDTIKIVHEKWTLDTILKDISSRDHYPPFHTVRLTFTRIGEWSEQEELEKISPDIVAKGYEWVNVSVNSVKDGVLYLVIICSNECSPGRITRPWIVVV